MMLYNIRKKTRHAVVAAGELILKNRAIAVAAAAILLIIFAGFLRPAIVVILLVAAASLSMFYNRFVPQVSLGFELVTLATVITGFAYGGLLAALVGFAALFLAEIVGGRMTGTTIISFFGIIIAGLLVPVMKPWGITAAGIAATIIYDAIIFPLYIMTGSRLWKSLLFVGTHLIFNTWVFFSIAPLVQRAIA